MWRTIQKALLVAGGGGAACFLLVLLLSSGLQADPVSVDTTFGGVNERIFVVRGADGIIYYSLYQLKATPATGAGAFAGSACSGNGFTLDTDVNQNRWPDSNAGATPFRPVPGSAAAASDPSIHLTNRPGSVSAGVGTPETGLLVSVLGNDGNLYWTILDLDCDQTFTVPTIFTTAAGFGDTDKDGWPGPTNTSNPWLRASP